MSKSKLQNKHSLKLEDKRKKKAGLFSWVVGLGALGAAAFGAANLDKVQVNQERPIASGPSRPDPMPGAAEREIQAQDAAQEAQGGGEPVGIERGENLGAVSIGFVGVDKLHSLKNHYEIRHVIFVPADHPGVVPDADLEKKYRKFLEKEEKRTGRDLTIERDMKAIIVPTEKVYSGRAALKLPIPPEMHNPDDGRVLVAWVAEVDEEGKVVEQTDAQSRNGVRLAEGMGVPGSRWRD